MSYLTCIRGVHIPGAHLCCGSRDVYMYNIYVERERERGMVCVFVCMCARERYGVCMCASMCVYLTPYPSIYVTRIQEEQNKMQKNK